MIKKLQDHFFARLFSGITCHFITNQLQDRPQKAPSFNSVFHPHKFLLYKKTLLM